MASEPSSEKRPVFRERPRNALHTPGLDSVRRPAVPGQIREIDELKVGQIIVGVQIIDGKAEQENQRRILSEPYQRDGRWFVKTELTKNIAPGGSPEELSLADMGITTYETETGQKWSMTNYVLAVEETTDSA